MPRLWLEGPACLSYRPGSRGSRLSLFHVKLTDAALQALLAHRRLQGAPLPVIAFRGSQGYLRIPRPPDGRPGPRSRLFSFFLSRCSREEPQASFDLVRRSARRLECEGVIRERLTVCATAEAPACRFPRARLERGRRGSSPAAAAPCHGKGFSCSADPGATARVLAAAGGEGPSTGELRAIGPFLARLLALPPQQKDELLGRADRAGLRVLAALREVGRGQVAEGLTGPSKPIYPSQTGPPGTQDGSRSPEEEPQLGRAQEDGPAHPSGSHRRRARTAWPRPFPPASPVGGPCRKSRQTLRAALEPRASRWQGPGFPGAQSSWWGRKVAPVAIREGNQPCFGTVRREPLSQEQVEGEAETDQQGQTLPAEQRLSERADGLCCGDPQETPDFSLNYGPISSTQQCQAYKEAFGTDYAEYRLLHARIATVSKRFAQLGARIQALQRGTEHYKVLESQIMQEYQQFKQAYPNYQQEKQHCEYLHKKLSHIKEQILSFEQNMLAAEIGGNSGGR